MRLLLGLILIALTIPFSISPAFAADETAYERVMRSGVLKCGVFAWPPYFEVDQNTHEMGGKAKPFYDAVASLLDLKIEYIELNFATYVEDMKQGRVDAFCNDGPYTISLAKQVNYVTPWLYAPVFAYGRADEARIKTLTDFNQSDFKFVGMDGDLSVDLKNRLFPAAQLVSVSTMTDYSQMLLDIVGKRADAMILDVPSFDKFNANNPHKIKALTIKPLAVYPVGLSVIKSEHELWQTLNTATEMAINMGFADKALHDLDPTGKALYPVEKPYKAPK